MIFVPLNFFQWRSCTCKCANILETKVGEIQMLISHFGICFHFFTIHILAIRRSHKWFKLVNSWGGALLAWNTSRYLRQSNLETYSWVWKGGVYKGGFALANTQFHHMEVVECHTISEWGWFLFEFLFWLMCGDHKSEDLCCMICVSPPVFVELCLFLWIHWLGCYLNSTGKGVAKVWVHSQK
jgi:hypothetical protein